MDEVLRQETIEMLHEMGCTGPLADCEQAWEHEMMAWDILDDMTPTDDPDGA
jgi:hypothetical protein